jgi:hypothetical protein
MMEATHSSKTSVLTGATQHHIPEDSIFQNQRFCHFHMHLVCFLWAQ